MRAGQDGAERAARALASSLRERIAASGAGAPQRDGQAGGDAPPHPPTHTSLLLPLPVSLLYTHSLLAGRVFDDVPPAGAAQRGALYSRLAREAAAPAPGGLSADNGARGPSSGRRSALWRAARAGDCVAVRRLLAGGANVSDANPNFLDSLPIHYAALVQRPAAAPRLPGMLPCRAGASDDGARCGTLAVGCSPRRAGLPLSQGWQTAHRRARCRADTRT